MNRYLLGIDLGTINDYTATAVVQRYGEYEQVKIKDGRYSTYDTQWVFKEYRLLHLERYLGEPYTEIVQRIKTLSKREELGDARMIVDATGVGRPVVDLLVQEGLKRVVPVTITGGDDASSARVNGRTEYRVPKRDLVGTLQVLLQNRHLKIPNKLDLKRDLVAEMQNFKVKLNAETGHESFEHWRSSDHDDLVLAVALACWYEQHRTGRPSSIKFSHIPH